MNQDQNNFIPQDNNINQSQVIQDNSMNVQPTTPMTEVNANQPKKPNKMIIIVIGILIVVAICIILFLTVFSNKKDNSSNKNSDNNTVEESTNNKTQSKYYLIDYEDPDFKYTLKSLDASQNKINTHNDYGSSIWYINDEDHHDLVRIYYSEYNEKLSLFKNQEKPTAPEQIISSFSDCIKNFLSYKNLHAKDLDEKTFKFESIKINGLDAVKFKDTIKCDDEKNIRDYGFTGVAVLGKKRSYLFWAIDLTEDMGKTDEALDIILEALQDFKEGE